MSAPTKTLDSSTSPPGASGRDQDSARPASAGPVARDNFKRTTVARVAKYTRRKRYVQRGPQLIEVERIEPWAKNWRVYLRGQPEAFFVVGRDYPAYVRCSS